MSAWEPLAPLLLLLIVLVSLVLYVTLDGFDLGVGTLSLFERDNNDRHEMRESIATVWDGNESWLVMAAAAVFAGFPPVFGIVLSALYLPLTVMLLALVFRGVSFEFGAQHGGYDPRWGLSFSLGSVVAAFCQGVAFGALLEGTTVVDEQFAGGTFDFLSPFSVLMGLFVTAFYSLSGAGWMVCKMHGELLERSRKHGRALSAICALLLLIVLAVAAVSSPVAENALAGGRLLLVAGAVAMTLVALWGAYVTFGRRNDGLPLVCASLALVALIVGTTVAAYPYLVPPEITYEEAAAPSSSAMLMLVVVGPLIPITIAYNSYSYFVFRGKQKTPESDTEDTSPNE